MEKVDILAIALCIVVVIFAGYIAYLKEGINFCLYMIARQQNAIEGLAKALETNNTFMNKQCEWNDTQVSINKAQSKFNNEVEKHIKANSINAPFPTGGRRSEAEA